MLPPTIFHPLTLPFKENFSKNSRSSTLNLYIFSIGFLRHGCAPHARGVYDQIFSKKPKNWRHTWQKR
jgi:hypothetical protein